jgi:hypothetical protein
VSPHDRRLGESSGAGVAGSGQRRKTRRTDALPRAHVAANKRFVWCCSQHCKNARNWQPRIIPRIGLAFQVARMVSSKGWLFDAGCEKRHQSVDFRDFPRNL